jgi:hypothetical protein
VLAVCSAECPEKDIVEHDQIVIGYYSGISAILILEATICLLSDTLLSPEPLLIGEHELTVKSDTPKIKYKW